MAPHAAERLRYRAPLAFHAGCARGRRRKRRRRAGGGQAQGAWLLLAAKTNQAQEAAGGRKLSSHMPRPSQHASLRAREGQDGDKPQHVTDICSAHARLSLPPRASLKAHACSGRAVQRAKDMPINITLYTVRGAPLVRSIPLGMATADSTNNNKADIWALLDVTMYQTLSGNSHTSRTCGGEEGRRSSRHHGGAGK